MSDACGAQRGANLRGGCVVGEQWSMACYDGPVRSDLVLAVCSIATTQLELMARIVGWLTACGSCLVLRGAARIIW